MRTIHHKRTWVLLLVFLGALVLCISSVKQPSALRLVVPKGWPKPVYTFQNNTLSAAGFQLGRALFYDPRLSKDGTKNIVLQVNLLKFVFHIKNY